jgi:O-antigen/teichoic acid export membrane protein
MSLTRALKWSFVSELASKGIPPIIFIVIARVITPEDFGVVTSALMVISFSQVFWDAGMSKALIQRQNDIEDASNVVFWVNVILGIIVASFLFLEAIPIAHFFFHDMRVASVIQIMTLQVLLGAISSVHTALLQKKMDFQKLFWVRLTTALLPGLLSIPFAFNGMGYWALILGTLVGQVAQVLILWRISNWRPSLRLPGLNLICDMLKYGIGAFFTGITAWFYIWADSLAIGYFFSIHEMGLYRLASTVVNLGGSLIFGSIGPVLFSHLSKHGIGDFKKLKDNMILMAFVTAILICFGAPILEKYFLGEQWYGISFLIVILALVNLVGNLWAGNSEGYAATANPGADAKIYTIALFYYIPAYFYLGQLGSENFAIGRMFLVVLSAPLHIYYSSTLLNYGVREYANSIIKAILPALLFSIILFSIQFLLLQRL